MPLRLLALRLFTPILFISRLAAITIIAMPMAPTPSRAQSETDVALSFLVEYETNVKPLDIAIGKAWWKANTTGNDKDFAEKEALEKRYNELLSSPAKFETLKGLQHDLGDPQLTRQMRLLYLEYLDKQVDVQLLNRMSAKANEIEKKFNVFRAKVGDKTLTDSEVRDVLKNSKDLDERKQVWEAAKQVGAEVAPDLRELVLLRNQAAQKLGFADFHVMQLQLNEQKQADVLALFDELDELTRQPFAQAKQEIDDRLAKQYGISVDELRPWHYHDPFFQEPQAVYAADLDAPFRNANILEICREFYDGIGLPIEDVLERSDLYEKPGKSPHAVCIDIDREGDVRVLANIKPNGYWMSTMLHELGHAVYSSKNIPADLPYVLRSDAHILATEGVAMMFERFCTDSSWLANYGVDVADAAQFDAASRRQRRDKLLIFSRWCQVMLRFEVALYKNPDQDLNHLWWNLVEEYQLLRRPDGREAPDYASKIHVVSAPAYYHNYMMGELFACQVHAAIVRDLGLSGQPRDAIYTRDPAVGRFMNEKVFGPGRLYPWNELTRHATGAELNAQAFAAEFQTE
ncbi:MAG: M2 family metallopeptidase [Bythopirellula sp.]